MPPSRKPKKPPAGQPLLRDFLARAQNPPRSQHPTQSVPVQPQTAGHSTVQPSEGVVILSSSSEGDRDEAQGNVAVAQRAPRQAPASQHGFRRSARSLFQNDLTSSREMPPQNENVTMSRTQRIIPPTARAPSNQRQASIRNLPSNPQAGPSQSLFRTAIKSISPQHELDSSRVTTRTEHDQDSFKVTTAIDYKSGSSRVNTKSHARPQRGAPGQGSSRITAEANKSKTDPQQVKKKAPKANATRRKDQQKQAKMEGENEEGLRQRYQCIKMGLRYAGS